MLNDVIQIGFTVRQAQMSDLDQLIELEKVWPENTRASRSAFYLRLTKFPQGFFVAQDEDGIIASLICCPYIYNPFDLSFYQSWEKVVQACYKSAPLPATNALYIVSATTKKSNYGLSLIEAGLNHAVKLANKMNKSYVVAGIILPGYAKYIEKHGDIDAKNYAFKKIKGRFIDPLIETCRRMDFIVPDEHHILANYFSNEASLNYSALIVKQLR